MRRLAPWLSLLALHAAPAAAQRSALVLVQTDAAPEVLERARAGAIEALAEQGVRLVPTPDGAPCEVAACASELARTSAADAALLLEVSDEAVTASLHPATGEARSATEPFGDAGVSAATGAAVARLLESTPAAELGFLSVQTVPPGRRVRIDGRDAGTAPLRRSLAAGDHVVEVGETRREVTVEPRREAAIVIDEDPDADAEAEATVGAESDLPVGAPRSEPSPWNWVLGGALAVGGVVALISPLSTLARDGECTDRLEDVGCVEQVRIGPQSGVLLGIGAAALIAAVVVDVTAPIRVEVQASDTSASIRVRGQF